MAQTTAKKNGTDPESFFTSANRIVIALGVCVVIIGFYALAQMPVYGTVTMYVAPLLLVGGFLVIIPIGILMGGTKHNDYEKESSGD